MALRGVSRGVDYAARALGSDVDDDAFGRCATSTSSRGSTVFLALGTAGEGILLRVDERRHVADLFLQAADNRLQVDVHCGAQTTHDTVALAAHAAEVGADAVVVIGPLYFKLDEHAQYAHFLAAAAACAPLPFYVYEFAATTGYPIAPAVLERLHDTADNVVGLKVSDRCSTRSRSTSCPASTSSWGRSRSSPRGWPVGRSGGVRAGVGAPARSGYRRP